MFSRKPKPDKIGGVMYIHHQPKQGNLGDDQCSPKNHFQIERGPKLRAIVGGGAMSDHGLKALHRNRVEPDRAVLWGTGVSIRTGESEPVKDLPYLDWGLRDIDGLEDRDRFLPCVSCMLPMLGAPVKGSGTLLFVNGDERVTSSSALAELKLIASDRGWTMVTNQCSLDHFHVYLAHHDHFVTNSYHGAYWSLLSGRRISLIGYSTKFVSLLAGFGLQPDQLVRVEKKDSQQMVDAVASIESDDRAYSLPNASETLRQFRVLQMQFAQRLLDSGIVKSIQPLYVEMDRAES